MRNLFLGLAGTAIFCLAPAARAEYVGDYNVGDTVCGYFNTYRPSTGALFTLASEAVAAYKDASATPDTSGVTIDDDFTGTGTHKVCVDTSQDGTFFSAGSQFSVQLTAGTVDSVSIANAEVLSFSLLDGTLATIEAQTDDIGTAGAGLTGLGGFASGAIAAADFNADVDAEFLSYIVDDAERIDASELNGDINSLTFTLAGDVDANMQSVSDDTTPANRLEAVYDGTAGSYPEHGVIRGIGVAAQSYTHATGVVVIDAAAAFPDNVRLPVANRCEQSTQRRRAHLDRAACCERSG
jgi:hypothetical protein